MNTTTLGTTRSAVPTTRLWQGALATAVLAGLAPRVNAVVYDHERIWHLDPEARLLLPIVVALPFVVAATVGTWAWRGSRSRTVHCALVLAVLAFLGILGFFVSLPIVFGGIAATLGLEARRRGATRGATIAIVLGLLACLAGTALWLFGA
ncbi:MAG: hypothetical protein QOI54_1358 [Actinomycetota bacterium]|nr:hypothetical protein [Actinomycetota bacterium]MDX6264318.1 hypothetical protein [Kribbellaceae bacterium]